MVSAMVTAAAIVVVGASTGAIETLDRLLPSLPATFPVPVVVVVHVPSNAPSLLVDLFRPRCALPVCEPIDKQPLSPGIFFAPPDYHLLVERSGTLSLSIDPPVNWSRPSIDVLFESAADAYRERTVGVVLSGYGADGSQGARAIREAGGRVFVQDPASADADEMPRAAIEAASPQLVALLPEIADAIRTLAPGDTP